MGIRTRKSSELSKEVRQEGAARVRQGIRQILSNPFLTPEQTATLQKQLSQLTVWEREGEAQVVEFEETVPLSDE